MTFFTAPIHLRTEPDSPFTSGNPPSSLSPSQSTYTLSQMQQPHQEMPRHPCHRSNYMGEILNAIHQAVNDMMIPYTSQMFSKRLYATGWYPKCICDSMDMIVSGNC